LTNPFSSGQSERQLFDLHTHTLPALGDGPATLEESLALLASLARVGVTDIVATPYFAPIGGAADILKSSAPGIVGQCDLLTRAAAVQKVARNAGLAVRLYVGHETRLNERLTVEGVSIEALLGRGAIATINDGPYVLLSLPTVFDLGACFSLIRRLRRSGFAPILAHAERSALAQADARYLRPLVAAGALTQITLASVTGAHGVASQATAQALLQMRLAHIVASGARCANDAPLMAEGLRIVGTLVGARRFWELTVEAPAAVVAGDPIVPMLDYPPRIG